MKRSRDMDTLSRRTLEGLVAWDPFIDRDPDQVASQVDGLPDVLREILATLLATGRLATKEYRGLSLADLVEFTGSPILAVLWMGALIDDDEAFWPTISLRDGQLKIGDKDAHGVPREHLLVAAYGRALADVVGGYLKSLSSVATERAATWLVEIEEAIWSASIASASDADSVAEMLRSLSGFVTDERLRLLGAEDARSVEICVGAVAAFVAADLAYARDAGWVDEALDPSRRRGRQLYDPSDVAGMTTALARDASDEKEITPAVWARIYRRVESLSPILRAALAHVLRVGGLPRYEHAGVSLADLADGVEPLVALERMDSVLRDPQAAAAVLRKARQSETSEGHGAAEPTGGGDRPPRASLVAGIVGATVDFLAVLLDYADEPIAAVLRRFRDILSRPAGAVPAVEKARAAEVIALRRALEDSLGDSNESVGPVDLRRLHAGLDLLLELSAVR